MADLAASKGKEEKGEIHCGLLESLLQLRTAVPAVCNMGERVLLNVHVVSVTGRGRFSQNGPALTPAQG